MTTYWIARVGYYLYAFDKHPTPRMDGFFGSPISSATPEHWGLFGNSRFG